MKKQAMGVLGLVTGMTVAAVGGIIARTNTYAENVDFSVSVASSMNVTLTTDTVSLNLNPANASFASSTLTTSVGTNNQAGYELYMTSVGNSTVLTRTAAIGGTTPTIATLSSATSEASFPANRWGYKLSSDANYQPFTYDTTADPAGILVSSETVAVNPEDTEETITFGAKVDTNQAYGTYELGLVFTAVARPTTQDFIINFDSAAGVSSVAVKTGSATGTTVGTVTTSGGTVAGLGNNATYYLVPTFAEGYKFSAWANDSGSVGTLGTAGADGVVTYTVGDQVEVGDINSVTLASELDKIYMQTMVASQCVTTGPTTVTDSRDDKEYTVQRLADGKCWMTSNLNLAGGTALYSDDSNVPATGYTKASGNAYYTLPASQTITSGTSLPESAFSDNSTAYVFNTGNETTSQSDCTSSKPCNSYYSWLAATAGGKDASGSAVTSNGYNTAYSICPKGWRLPTSTTSNASATTSPNWKTGDWYALATAYGADLSSQHYQNAATFYNNAGPGTTPNILLAGSYYSGSFRNGGSSGAYWSATSSSNTNGYDLYFYSGSVYSADGSSRRYGFSVRCVLAEE